MPPSSASLALALNASQHLRAPDLAIIAAYLIAITLFGLKFRARNTQDKSLKNYFLAGNTIPWWAIALSVVSAETSTLTIISIPGVAFSGNFGFLQVVLGYLVGRVVVAVLFLPRYFAGEMLTAYQLIDRRFGPVLHKVTAGLFLLTRAAAEGVRVFAVSIVVSIAIGTGDILSIGIITALTLLYTFEGGLAAVIWTDVVQMAIYVFGTVVALISLGHHIPGGWSTIIHTAAAAHKFQTFNFAFNLTQSYTFWAGLLGGTFLTMASHGTDQLMVQRLLASRNLRESQLALLSSGVVIFFQFAFFLLIGAGLWVFYGGFGAGTVLQAHTPTGVFTWTPHQLPPGFSPDRLFPTFITHEMPTGIAGLLVAAILAAAMSNLSAALNSLSSTTVVDFYLRFRQPSRPPQPSPAPQTSRPPQSRVAHPLRSFTAQRVGSQPQPPPENTALGAPFLAPGPSSADTTVSDRERLLVSKASTALWAIVLFAIAILSLHNGGKGHVVEIGLSIASVAYGCLLGVFLLGTLTRYATEWGAILGMMAGFALNLWLWQGSFPVHLGPLTIPHIAFTWYVLIGAIVTFAIGSLASLVFKQSSRPNLKPALTTALLLFLLSFPQGIYVLHAQAQTQTPPQPQPPVPPAATQAAHASGSHPTHHKSTYVPVPVMPMPEPPLPPADFTPVSNLIIDAIAHHQLPGAVVVIGHRGHIAFQHAYGDRKLAGEPGLSGEPSPAEPMTEDTIFDMASLTKVIVTTTAIGQLYDAGKVDFDTPLDHYLPDFNPTHDPERREVTLRLLLTHFSGEPPDINLKDPWGLTTPDKAEGLHRALTTPLATTPGTKFVYSDINFILLGALIEELSGTSLETYARAHIFAPLGMLQTSYLPLTQVCGKAANVPFPSRKFFTPNTPPGISAADLKLCQDDGREWSADEVPNTAPTAHDDEGTLATNPNFNHLLRGTVHDPTTRRMGGVAGHAGVFSTAHDMTLFAQALLDRYAGRSSNFPLQRKTLILMSQPQQPGHTPFQVGQHFRANAQSIAQGQKPATGDPNLLDPNFPAIKDEPLRGFGWDIDTGYSKPRGRLPIGTFGHTGFTGTSLWLDPNSDTFVLLLANAIHPHPGTPISNLRGEVASAAALALGLYNSDHQASGGPSFAPAKGGVSSKARPSAESPQQTPQYHTVQLEIGSQSTIIDCTPGCTVGDRDRSALTTSPPTQTGLDTLESTHFAALTPYAHVALLTNQTGLDSHNRRTVDILCTDLPKVLPNTHLTALFSPEHGIFGQQDTEHLTTETDPSTHLPVTSLYGPHESDRRPSHTQLANLDAVLIDLQDAGLRCFTYETVLGYFLEAAATERTQYHHDLHILVLDRPNPLNGLTVAGPISDPGTESYINYQPIFQHGLTLGEFARYIVVTRHLDANLTVIPMQNWRRRESFDDTNLPWTPPSPNLHTLTANLLYPATTMLEFTNLSVGRGTPIAFEVFGAPLPTTARTTNNQQPTTGWFNAQLVATTLNARHIPGVTFQPIQLPVPEDKNHYPGHGQTIPAVHIQITDRTRLDAAELGLELLSTLHKLYPTQFQIEKSFRILANRATLDALIRGDDPRTIAAAWTQSLADFKARRSPYLLYPE